MAEWLLLGHACHRQGEEMVNGRRHASQEWVKSWAVLFHSFKADLRAFWSQSLAGGHYGWSLGVSGKNELVGTLQGPLMPLRKRLWLQEAQYAWMYLP